ncbi:MAG: hypothetical protein JWO08_467, partial [Verrucomicrobiaceae bacterium]|nr:hypothetical protein [Verrucomicrobiaceae bacterium]
MEQLIFRGTFLVDEATAPRQPLNEGA